ncbi:13607_t:CDS:2 [Cetraspora pellucida]|uniref:13607_t:CDS:1 n=1 Tax=Cetraspora pellucida TaxID=1433469 RepID=A0ACA9K2V8_9GLOM|nr:13607_t:CDS:2 [Cetraspora pellucida]
MTPRTVILTRPPIKVPSPFEFNISEFLPRKSIGCKTSNAFMIYRKVYVKTLLRHELHSKMTEASCWAAKSWNEESIEVKNDFKRFAKKLKEIYRHKSKEAIEAQNLTPTQFSNEPLINDNDVEDLMTNKSIPVANLIEPNESVNTENDYQFTQNNRLIDFTMIDYYDPQQFSR